MTQTSYILDTAEEVEARRLESHAELWDAFSRRRMSEIGLARGWRCLEVGGGAGTVASWLAKQVAPNGHVLATDLEARWLRRLTEPGLEIIEHDVVSEPLGESTYDLIHARLVLMHLPQAVEVLAKLTAALKPGGWLVVEDYDCRGAPTCVPADHPWATVAQAPGRLVDEAGGDGNFGTRLPDELWKAGLVEVDAEGLVKPARAPEVRSSWLPLIEQLREPMLALGLATREECDAVIDAFLDDDSELVVYGPMLVSARGRKPRGPLS